jgi:hypothetical protein
MKIKKGMTVSVNHPTMVGFEFTISRITKMGATIHRLPNGGLTRVVPVNMLNVITL